MVIMSGFSRTQLADNVFKMFFKRLFFINFTFFTIRFQNSLI